jgi:N-acetylglutamate synthase-like GNAT family acetyltransferase
LQTPSCTSQKPYCRQCQRGWVLALKKSDPSQVRDKLFEKIGFLATKEIRFFEKIGFLATKEIRFFEKIGFLATKEIRFFEKIGFLATKEIRFFEKACPELERDRISKNGCPRVANP